MLNNLRKDESLIENISLENNQIESRPTASKEEKAKNALEYLKNRFEDFQKLSPKDKLIILSLIMAGTGMTVATLAFALPTIAGATVGTSVFGSVGSASFGTYGFLAKFGFDTTMGLMGIAGTAGTKLAVLGAASGMATSTFLTFKSALSRLKNRK